jgi:hypothetical protein
MLIIRRFNCICTASGTVTVSGRTLEWLREISVEGNPYRKTNVEGNLSSPDIHKQGATVTASIFTKLSGCVRKQLRHCTVNLKVVLTIYLSTQTDGDCHPAGFHTTHGFSLTFSDGFIK